MSHQMMWMEFMTTIQDLISKFVRLSCSKLMIKRGLS